VNPKYHRYAILLAISALLLIAIGAYITSQATGRQPASRGILDGVIHKDVAIAIGIFAFGLAIWQSHRQETSALVWAAAALFALEGWIGWLGGAFLHASFAPLAFSILAAVALVTSPGWNQPPELVEDAAAPALRRFAFATPPLIFLQIMLGAAYRHKLIGILPHLGVAMIVTLAILGLAMLIRQRYPAHRKLRTAATWFLAILVAQVLFGFIALLMPELTASPLPIIIATAAHVVVGSLTLAANVVLAMQVQRCVQKL
jgi:heme A synthase